MGVPPMSLTGILPVFRCLFCSSVPFLYDNENTNSQDTPVRA
jgi:hypothetical protein